MIDFSMCYVCGSCLPRERDNHNLNTQSKATMGHSRCFSPQFPGRTSRSIKCSCVITAVLAFILGIGIGALIPLYFMPVNVDSLNLNNILHSSDSDASADFQHLTLTPQPVIMNQLESISSSSKDSDRTLYLNLDSSTDDSVSHRFPEFAQIQALRRDNNVDTTGDNVLSNKNTEQNQNPGGHVHPLYKRPSSNVKFVVPDSRILSLHPVQPEIPMPRFNHSGSSKNGSVGTKQGEQTFSSDEYLDGVYWSSAVEKKLPKGFTDQDIRSWRRFVKESAVSKIEEGCGRMQNRLLSMENGTRACCRYRHNFDQIQGEIFSFYLSQILNIRNLAPSALNIIQPLDQKWRAVRQQLNLAQWVEEKPVVLTRFIDTLSQAYIPLPFRDSNRRLHPVDLLLSSNLLEKVVINELAQWSDLIVFDYLTANLDRMVNNLYNLQWNPSMMEAPAHNLAKDTTTGQLIFLDNESGLLHGYRLLDKYEQYHRVMLDSLCIFRRSTADAVKRLHRDKNVGHLLKSMFQNLEPALINYLPMIPEKSIKILNHRIDRVYDQITKCESLYTT